MSTDTIISVEGVSKKFCRSLKRTMLYGVADAARDVWGISPSDSTGLRSDEFWALDNVSFEVKRGECVGLIGPNGAGKSTLLKLINGITLPDKGTVKVTGRVGALLELGAGFHPMLTGRENIQLSGTILGLGKAELADKFDSIVDFAGLEEFIDSPVKQYSSGMYVRLGFAVAVHAEPEVFLVDEALAVGDALFQSKCFSKLREFKARGTTVIFVTHSLDMVSAHCSRAMMLEKGKLVAQGEPKQIVDRYNRQATIGNRAQLSRNQLRIAHHDEPPDTAGLQWHQHFRLNLNEDRYGCRRAEIIEAGIFTLEGSPTQCLQRNEEYVIKIKVRHNEAMPAAIVAYTIKDGKGVVLCGTNTLFQRVEMGWMDKANVVTVAFKQTMRLNPGSFLLCVGAANYENGQYIVYDRRFDYMCFEVVGSQQRMGVFDLDSTIEWARCGAEPGSCSDGSSAVCKSGT